MALNLAYQDHFDGALEALGDKAKDERDNCQQEYNDPAGVHALYIFFHGFPPYLRPETKTWNQPMRWTACGANV